MPGGCSLLGSSNGCMLFLPDASDLPSFPRDEPRAVSTAVEIAGVRAWSVGGDLTRSPRGTRPPGSRERDRCSEEPGARLTLLRGRSEGRRTSVSCARERGTGRRGSSELIDQWVHWPTAAAAVKMRSLTEGQADHGCGPFEMAAGQPEWHPAPRWAVPCRWLR